MSSFNLNNRNLTSEQQRLLTMYTNQYNQTNEHINILLDMLEETRGNIINIINTIQPRRNIRRPRSDINDINSNSNISRIINQILNNRQDSYVNYDYENPIDPNIYDLNFSNNSNIRTNTRRNATNNIIGNYSHDHTRNLLDTFLNSNVIVRPTSEQIQNATRLVRYTDINNPISLYCPISLDVFNNNDEVRQILHCGHIFHQSQFQEWFQNNVRCPVCRYDIRNYRPLSTTNEPITDEPTTNNLGSEIPLSNINIRDPNSNEVEQVNDQHFTNNFIDRVARNIFQSLLNPNGQNQNSNDRIMIDPSNNIIFYETILRPNSNQQNN